MLVLSRRIGEALYLNEAKVIVIRTGKGRVAIGIDAPRNVKIAREPIAYVDELREVEEQIELAMTSGDEVAGLKRALDIVQAQIRQRSER